jgi:hypothetical protein
MINLIKKTLSSDNKYSHLVFLSGSCYPQKKIPEIKIFFEKNISKQVINIARTCHAPNHMRSLSSIWLYEIFPTNRGKLIRILRGITQYFSRKINRKLPTNYPIPFYGSQWMALTPECAKYVINYCDENKWFLKYLKYSLAPDEIAIQTIVGNSPFISSSNIVDGGPFSVTDLANYHLLHPSLSKWYNISDINEIELSNKLFLRKVNTLISSKLLDKIDDNNSN